MTTDKLVRESRQAQALPEKITDLSTLSKVVALLLKGGGRVQK